MEAHRFESAESADSSELIDDTATVAKKKRKKKSGSTAGATGEAEQSDVSREVPAKTELIENSKTLWQRLVGESSDDESEKGTDKAKDEVALEVNDTSDEALPLETLTEEERLLAVEAYIATRQQELTQEAAAENVLPEEAAVAAANQTFLHNLQNRLRHERPEAIDQAVEVAYTNTVEAYIPPEEAATLHPDAIAPEMGAEPLSDESVIPLRSSAERLASPLRQPYVRSAVEAEPDRVQSTGPALLAGGVIGYLVGRRRGRIKTEKRLQPIQQKLEKEIATVQAIITQKEAAVRTLMRERHPAAGTVAPVKATAETAKAKPTAAKRQEKLGLMTLQAIEKAPSVTAKKEATVSETTAQAASMSRGELLAASGEITVGATTLRQVYETKLISERALRRLVHEHQHGGDVRRILREEMLAKELSYERDPRLRDRPLTVSSGGAAAPNRSQPVLPLMSATSKPAANTARPVAVPTATTKKKSPKPVKRQTAASPVLVAANVTALIILAVLLIVLVVTRHTHRL